MFRMVLRGCVLAGIVLNAINVQAGDLRLADIFQSRMVVQRDKPFPVWGHGKPGAEVVVEFAGQTAKAKADDAGRWSLKLAPVAAGEAGTLVAASGDERVVCDDVLAGDIWICSGQSNMEWPLARSSGGEEAIAASADPWLRLLRVERKVDPEPSEGFSGKWAAAAPESSRHFSAVGYYFGRELRARLEVPIGLVDSSWGGTPARAWTERNALEREFPEIIEEFERTVASDAEGYDEARLALWEMFKPTSSEQRHQDVRNFGFDWGWHKPEFNDANWATMDLPKLWESLGDHLNLDGSCWFRRQVEIPAAWAGKNLRLSLGAIDDFDVSYFNGEQVGATGAETENFWQAQRNYVVPAKLVKKGMATIAVRVFDHYGVGGFAGPDEQMSIAPEGMDSGVSLAGEWKWQFETPMQPIARPSTTSGRRSPHSPAGLFNGMIRPLAPFAIKGAIWYQGESDAGRAHQYRRLLPTLIQSWRDVWEDEQLPFLIVQLANFRKPSEQPGDDAWAELREAQAMTAAADPNVGLAVAIDIGEADDIHPGNKLDVGLRLALSARNIAHGEKDLVFSGPIFRSAKFADGKALLEFDHVGGGLQALDGGPLRRFEIAGADRRFHWAEAAIKDGKLVEVSSAAVKEPVAVRYAWSINPEGCNFGNAEGLPAVPFRTDQFPGVTGSK